MDLESAIGGRRTHKAFRPEPVARQVVAELLDLARWAPNHHLTNPWRFRVLGPESLARLKRAAGPEAAPKLERAPTLIACTAIGSADPIEAEENLLAAACAAYIVLLAAHGRGLAAYWRTPGVLRTAEGLGALGIGPEERFVGLLYLGRPIQEQRAPEREPLEHYGEWLD